MSRTLGGPLVGLSFRPCAHGRQQPRVPSNEERMRAWQQAAPARPLGNAYPWAWREHEQQHSTR